MHSTHVSLIQRVRDASDQKSWAEFEALYRPLLRNYVRKKGLRDHDADDVVQNILIQLVKTLPSFELDHGRGRFRTYLWQLTNHAVVDWYRRRKRISEERAISDNLADAEAALRREPDKDWVVEERQRVVARVMEQIRAESNLKTWNCFEQHILKGRPAAEVGTELGLTANSVYVSASRVLAKVRDKCREYDEELGNG